MQNFADHFRQYSTQIQAWESLKKAELGTIPLPIYSSVDIRNAGFKISVVDTNLFPAGFNNLCETFSEQASESFKKYIREQHPSAEKILIFPEEHTRNIYYWKNIAALKHIIEEAGFQVRVGSASTLFEYPFKVEVENNTIQVDRLSLKDNYLRLEDYVPDLILMNNDLTTGTPSYFKNLHQPLLPSPLLGWHSRRKSHHFEIYKSLIEDLCRQINLDPWLLLPYSTSLKDIDLTDEICLQKLHDEAESLLQAIRYKYLQYGIQKEPYLYIKNDTGTYGMGLTHIRSGKEFFELNRKQRNKLQSAKGGNQISEYLLQEGVPTVDRYQNHPIEPVVYMVGGETVGTFFRIHDEKNDMESLNAPGMYFKCLCFHKIKEDEHCDCSLSYQNKEDLFTVTSLLGKIASMASSFELLSLKDRQELVLDVI